MFPTDSKVACLKSPLKNSNVLHFAALSFPSSLTSALPIADFMAALSDPGGFSKAAEKQSENMKGLGIEQTDTKADAKKKKEEEAKKGKRVTYPMRLYLIFSFFLAKSVLKVHRNICHL